MQNTHCERLLDKLEIPIDNIFCVQLYGKQIKLPNRDKCKLCKPHM